MNMRSYKCCAPKSYENTSILNQLDMLGLISEESRLKLLCILRSGEHCVSELMNHVELSQSLISHHLADLKQANIVAYDKRGREVYYSLTDWGKDIMVLLAELSKKEVRV